MYFNNTYISYCLIHLLIQFSFSSSVNQLLYNAVIFCYNDLTDPMPKFKEQSLIKFDGKDHVITKIDRVTEVYSEWGLKLT
nr:minor capsid protein [Enterococcus mundtii]